MAKKKRMDPSIMKLLEEDEVLVLSPLFVFLFGQFCWRFSSSFYLFLLFAQDETMHSGADVDAFTAALNRDIEGDASASQPSDDNCMKFSFPSIYILFFFFLSVLFVEILLFVSLKYGGWSRKLEKRHGEIYSKRFLGFWGILWCNCLVKQTGIWNFDTNFVRK